LDGVTGTFLADSRQGRPCHGGDEPVRAALRGLASAAGQLGGCGSQKLVLSARPSRADRSSVPPNPVPQPIRSIVLDEVGSTNAEAFALAKAGETGPLWLMAHRQTAGRGRSGRSWASEPGNLHASLLQGLGCPAPAVPQLSLLAGVAVIDAIAAAAAGAIMADLRLKWPNDVLIGGAKCAGILPECHSGGPTGRLVAVVGIGINLAWHPPGLARAATHLAAHGVAGVPGEKLPQPSPALRRSA